MESLIDDMLPEMIFADRRRNKSTALSLMLVVATVTVTDQATKWFILTEVMNPPRIIPITPFFNLVLTFNKGVSFGMFQDFFAPRPGFLALIGLAIVAVLVAWALRAQSKYERLGLAMISGGALGNIIDRWRQGAVTDFLDFYWQDLHWPTFNAADVFIFAGTAVLFTTAVVPGLKISEH